MLTIPILPEPVFAVGIRYRATRGRADTHGNDQQFVFLCLFGNLQGRIDRIFTIAQNNERIGASLGSASLEIKHSLAENEPEVRAAHSGPVAVDLFERIAQGGVVVGEGNDQISLSGKDNQPDFIPRQGIYQLISCGPCLGQARRFHILRLHGA